jgi:hypothetical protein
MDEGARSMASPAAPSGRGGRRPITIQGRKPRPPRHDRDAWEASPCSMEVGCERWRKGMRQEGWWSTVVVLRESGQKRGVHVHLLLYRDAIVY